METVAELGYSNLDYYEIVFPNLGIDITIDPTAFTIGGFSIQWYGIIIAVGLLLAFVFGFRNFRRVGIDPDRAIDAVIGGVIGGLIGARLYYVAFNWSDYAGDISAILNTRNGGLAIYGGIIGAFLVGSIVAKLRGLRLLPLYDVVATGFLLGQGIGRWGNFVNQEAFGTNTDSLFCMSGGKIQSWIENTYSGDVELSSSYCVHPCFLYESLWCLLGFVIFLIILKNYRKFDGQMFLLYIGWYGLERAIVEGFRTDSLYIGTLRVSQCVAILCVVVSVILLCICFARVKRLGSDYKLYVFTEHSKEMLAKSDAMAKEQFDKRQEKRQKRLDNREQRALEKEGTLANTDKIIPDPEEPTDVTESVDHTVSPSKESASEE